MIEILLKGFFIGWWKKKFPTPLEVKSLIKWKVFSGKKDFCKKVACKF